ncbi:hypothetical protein, partial [Citrobacter sp. VF227]
REAYKCNDLLQVKDIYEALKAGGIRGVRSSTLSESEALRTAIAELDFTITRIVSELKALQASDGVKLMDAAGFTESEWQAFFQKRYETLEVELAMIVSELLAEQTEDIGFP